MSGQVKMQVESESVQNVIVPIGTGKEKRCLKCGEVKAVGEFWKDRRLKCQLRARCKDCDIESAKKNYLKIEIIKEKECKKCGCIKPIDNFHKEYGRKDGRSSHCKECHKGICLDRNNAMKDEVNAKRRELYAKNPDDIKKANRKSYIKNSEKRKAYSKKKYSANREKALEYCKLRRLKNLERIRASDRRRNKIRTSTPEGKLDHTISTAIWAALKGKKNGRKWQELLGYNIFQLKAHLEKQFKLGMNWNNYGEYWHIDHIVPKILFNYSSPEHIDFKRCWCLKNLQPLEARENLSKGAKILKSFQPSLGL